MHRKKTRTSLWVAVRFTQLPLDVLEKKTNQPALVIEKNEVCACNKQARDLDIYPGISQAKAQLCILQKISDDIEEKSKSVIILNRDKNIEEQYIFDLCDKLYLITPYIKPKNKKTKSNTLEQGLILEVSMSVHLFKGIKNIEKRIIEILEKTNFSYTLRYGDTEESAWLSTYTEIKKNEAFQAYENIEKNIKEYTKNIIKNIDIRYLYDFPKEIQKLNSMGFNTFGDLENPIKKSSFFAIRKRLGNDFTLYLSNIINLQEEQDSLFKTTKSIYEPKKIFKETVDFGYPIKKIDHLKPYIEDLLVRLHDTSIKKSQETHEVIWIFYDIKKSSKEYRITFDPNSFQWKFIYDLSLIQFEHGGLPFEVNSLELKCLYMDERNYQNLNLKLVDKSNINQASIPSLPLLESEYGITTAKLQSRIGQTAIKKIALANTHIPEQASVEYDFNDQDKNTYKNTLHNNFANRPEWLFNVPKAIGRQQNQLNWQGRLNIIQGPERIQGNWWHKPIARDYFIAQRDDFTRLWIYHDLKKNQWYAQGIFA